jgi:hypothetical protein
VVPQFLGMRRWYVERWFNKYTPNNVFSTHANAIKGGIGMLLKYKKVNIKVLDFTKYIRNFAKHAGLQIIIDYSNMCYTEISLVPLISLNELKNIFDC